MYKRLILLIVLAVSLGISPGQAEGDSYNRLEKLTEDSKVIIYLENDTLSSNLSESSDHIPSVYKAGAWLCFTPKDNSTEELRVYYRWEITPSTEQAKAKRIASLRYKDGVFISGSGEQDWQEILKGTNGYDLANRVFSISVLEWDLYNYMLTGKSKLNVVK